MNRRASKIAAELKKSGNKDLAKAMMDAIKYPKGYPQSTPDEEDKNNYLDPDEQDKFMDDKDIDDVDLDPGDLYGVPTLDQVRALSDDDDDLAEALKELGL